MSDISELKKELLTHFDNQKLIKYAKASAKFFQAANLSFEQEIDFYIELSKRNPEFFMDKIYPGLQMVGPVDKRNDYILHKYCLLEGEEILNQFYGSVSEKKTTSTGKVVLTNFRIISFGKQVTRSAQSQVMVKPRLGEMLVRSAITRHRKAIQKAILRSFHKDLKQWDLPEWGYYYPIYNIKKLKRGKNSISYTIEVETEKKSMSVQITIAPLRKDESKQEFANYQQSILDQLEQKLSEN